MKNMNPTHQNLSGTLELSVNGKPKKIEVVISRRKGETSENVACFRNVTNLFVTDWMNFVLEDLKPKDRKMRRGDRNLL